MLLPWDVMKRMSDNELEAHRLIRGLLLPKGQQPPAEWLAAHPHAIRIPFHMTLRPVAKPAAPATQTAAPATRPLADGNRSYAPITRPPPAIPTLLPDPHAATSVAQFGRPSYAPILRVSGTGTAPATDTTDTPSTRLSAPAHPAPQRPAELRPDELSPVPFVDEKGNPVLDQKGNQMMRPKGFDPRFFVEQGIRDRNKALFLIFTNPNPAALTAKLADFIFQQLRNFGQGRAWDAQRLGNRFHREFVDFATVAIGLYAAALGLTRAEILAVQNEYAAIYSRFDPDRSFDPVYTSLPSTNVYNTDLGMALYDRGRIVPFSSLAPYRFGK